MSDHVLVGTKIYYKCRDGSLFRAVIEEVLSECDTVLNSSSLYKIRDEGSERSYYLTCNYVEACIVPDHIAESSVWRIMEGIGKDTP